MTETGAVIDSTGKYRYLLWRIWDQEKPKLLFIMLNPSTADGKEDDPTIRRCINYAKVWGYGSIEVVNLFALRATNPSELLKAADPIGQENDKRIIRAVDNSERVIAAWGTKGTILNRNIQVMRWLKGIKKIHCLEITKDGHPKHPLYAKGNLNPMIYMEG